MKCINKPRLRSCILFVVVTSILFCGCGASKEEVLQPYQVYDNANYQFESSAESADIATFSNDLCVIGTEDSSLDNTDYQAIGGAGYFNVTTGEVKYAYHLHDKLYPASTTKILTCYIAVTTTNLDDIVTVSENAVNQASDSSVCELEAGDQISMRDLLYGMMLRSGNDAAVAIAEYISGDISAFATLMNDTARKLGATNSNFVNPNGLPDENHYTTVYDMYLILNKAIQNSDFLQIFTSHAYTASYTDASGLGVTKDWVSTNKYLIGEESAPDGMTVLGGKTGTTGDAGYCLVQLVADSVGNQYIIIVFKADSRWNLYLLMDEMMTYYSN